MPLANMRELLLDAQKRKYAVGCYNVINLEMCRGIIEAAEAERSPVILCHAQMHFQYAPLEMIGPIMVRLAQEAKVPVGVHLDHGHELHAVLWAMHLGFTSVMYDGSTLPLAENIQNTLEVVRIARELGVSVEAELGHVVRPAGGGAEEDGCVSEDSEDLHTKPEEAAKFVAQTGVDALAVAYGTAHGIYLTKPKLDFERLSALARVAGVPLVMHGGSGLSPEDFTRSISQGICKINYYTNMALAVAKDLKEKLNKATANVFYHDVIGWERAAIRKDIAATMRIFNSAGKD